MCANILADGTKAEPPVFITSQLDVPSAVPARIPLHLYQVLLSTPLQIYICFPTRGCAAVR